MACNPSHINHLKKKKFQQRHSTPINQNINTIAQQKSQKLKKVVWTCKDGAPPETSTYERPFTREGIYLVSFCYILDKILFRFIEMFKKQDAMTTTTATRTQRSQQPNIQLCKEWSSECLTSTVSYTTCSLRNLKLTARKAFIIKKSPFDFLFFQPPDASIWGLKSL